MNVNNLLKVVRGNVRTSALPLNEITEVVSSALTFEGKTFGAVDRTDLDQWQIKKITTAGIETIGDFKTSGSFDQVWDDRVSLFPYANNFSLLLDGVDEHLTIGSPANLDFIQSSTFSWSIWFKTSTLASAQTWLYKGVGGANADNSIRFSLPTNGRPQFSLRVASLDRVLVRMQDLTGTIEDGNWHHIVVTWDGSTTTVAANALIYFDGALGTMSTQNDTLTGSITTGDDWFIGTVENLASNMWNGNLDEISVWDKALSLSEVQELYNSGVTKDILAHSATANNISTWPFNKNSDFPSPRDIKDSNPLTMVNMEAGDYSTDTA